MEFWEEPKMMIENKLIIENSRKTNKNLFKKFLGWVKFSKGKIMVWEIFDFLWKGSTKARWNISRWLPYTTLLNGFKD